MLEKEFWAYYSSTPKVNKSVDKVTFGNFITFFEQEALKHKFLNPYNFSEKYDGDIDDSIRVFTLLTDDSISPPILKLRPYFQCISNNCYLPIFLDDENLNIDYDVNNFSCVECDYDYNFEVIKDEISFVYEIPKKYRDLLLMKDKSSAIQKIEVISPETLKKSYLPSSNNVCEEFYITSEEKKGAITYEQVNKSNIDKFGKPQSSQASSITKRFAQKRALRNR